MTHQFCNKYVTFIVSTDIQSKQQRPKVQTAVQVGWACGDASCNEVSSCSSSVSNKRKLMTVWLLGDAIHEAFTWLALKHMANGEQISTEVLLSLQTFDHNGKKRTTKKKSVTDWTTLQSKPLKSHSAWLSANPEIAYNIFLTNNNLVCVNQIMTVSVIALHNENDLN